MNGKIGINLLLVASYVVLTGFFWGDAEDDASKFIRDVKARTQPSSSIDFGELPELQPYRPFLYTEGANDPFKLKAFVSDNSLSPEDLNVECEGDDCGDPPPKPHEPYLLEQYDLGSLSMSGTIERQNEKIALIQTPDLGVQEVRIGEYMGKNYGEVVAIHDDHVLLQEKYRASRGWRDSFATLELFD